MKAYARSERRTRVPRERYRAVARHTGVRARLRKPLLVLDAALLGLAVLFLAVASPRVAAAVSIGIDDLGVRVGELFPTAQGSKQIDLPSGGGTVTADPVAVNLPDFTREPALVLDGRVPSFALVAGRSVEVSLNGALAATLTPDAAGAFATPLTLRDGPNAISLTLLSDKDVVAHSSYTVVLDRQPPALAVTKPVAGEVIDGTNVIVSGKAEAGATVIVNDRTIVPAQDGSFSESFTGTAGPLTITVVARDRAGNETTVKTPVTLKASSSAAPLTVSVTLNNTKVKPGQFVIAEIHVTANGLPKANELVTLSVGVITIGTATTDATGTARIGFASPPNEGDAAVVVLANGAAGRATLTVAK
jgi:hypothetical protein